VARVHARLGLLQAGLAVGLIAVVLRAAQVQLVDGGRYAAEASRSRTEVRAIPARRGTLYDRNGEALAVTQEAYRVGIAPNEVTDRAALIRVASRQLDVSAAELRKGFASGKAYLYYYGPFSATDVEPLRRFKGVHLDGVYLRRYSSGRLAARVVGRMGPDGVAASGLERGLDTLVTGVTGEEVVLKDRRGRRYESPGRLRREPIAGNDVLLTIDAELQDIAEQALADAVAANEAQGGDIVVLDPHTGEILAVASQKDGRPDLLAFTEPFEPGSTAKIFTAAALLALERVAPEDKVSGEGGTWELPLPKGPPRKLKDVHAEAGDLTLAEAIEVSSNIAMAKFSQRLTPQEQYQQLHDFGFGAPTGVELPSESRGLVRRPERWQAVSSGASVAIGYEFEVTAVQLAAAYAALANDGVLLTPTLVREIRAPDGQVLYRHQPEPVRRVVSPDVAAQLREFLREASGRGGTGARAQVGSYGVLGKTGTARRVRNGQYVSEYVASMAAIFPAEDPQLVVVVKIDAPSAGGIYGGDVAAPVVRGLLEQSLAARQVSFDRARLVAGAGAASTVASRRAARAADRSVVVVPWPIPADTAPPATGPVPIVVGLSVRAAALALHKRGFEVQLAGTGTVARSVPAAGALARPGSTVRLEAE